MRGVLIFIFISTISIADTVTLFTVNGSHTYQNVKVTSYSTDGLIEFRTDKTKARYWGNYLHTK